MIEFLNFDLNTDLMSVRQVLPLLFVDFCAPSSSRLTKTSHMSVTKIHVSRNKMKKMFNIVTSLVCRLLQMYRRACFMLSTSQRTRRCFPWSIVILMFTWNRLLKTFYDSDRRSDGRCDPIFNILSTLLS